MRAFVDAAPSAEGCHPAQATRNPWPSRAAPPDASAPTHKAPATAWMARSGTAAAIAATSRQASACTASKKWPACLIADRAIEPAVTRLNARRRKRHTRCRQGGGAGVPMRHSAGGHLDRPHNPVRDRSGRHRSTDDAGDLWPGNVGYQNPLECPAESGAGSVQLYRRLCDLVCQNRVPHRKRGEASLGTSVVTLGESVKVEMSGNCTLLPTSARRTAPP
jgi:hypothetical protein